MSASSQAAPHREDPGWAGRRDQLFRRGELSHPRMSVAKFQNQLFTGSKLGDNGWPEWRRSTRVACWLGEVSQPADLPAGGAPAQMPTHQPGSPPSRHLHATGAARAGTDGSMTAPAGACSWLLTVPDPGVDTRGQRWDGPRPARPARAGRRQSATSPDRDRAGCSLSGRAPAAVDHLPDNISIPGVPVGLGDHADKDPVQGGPRPVPAGHQGAPARPRPGQRGSSDRSGPTPCGTARRSVRWIPARCPHVGVRLHHGRTRQTTSAAGEGVARVGQFRRSRRA